MAVRVRIARKGEDIPEDFLYSVLASTLRMEKEEFERIKSEDGSVSLYVGDPEAIIKLQNISEKYGSMLDISFEKASTGIWELTNLAVKSNWGLVLSWSAVLVVLAILSTIPLISFFANAALTIFLYAFVIYSAFKLLKEKDVEKTFKSIRLGDVFSKAFGAGLGMFLGMFLLYIGVFVVSILFLFLAGALGALSDMVSHGRISGGTLSAIFAVVVLIFLFSLWFIYVMPLIYSKALDERELYFERAFKAVLSIVTPSFIRKSFSSEYIKMGGMWSLVVTIGITAMVLLTVFIVTIPLALIVAYWINVFLAISSARCVEEL